MFLPFEESSIVDLEISELGGGWQLGSKYESVNFAKFLKL